MRQRIALIACALLSVTLLACSSSSTETPPTPLGPYDGTWKWVQTDGGIAGMTYTPKSEGYTCTLQISTSAQAIVWRNDTMLATAAYPVVKITDSTYRFNFAVGAQTDSLLHARLPHVVLTSNPQNYTISLGSIGISRDTMVLWEHNVADGFESWFIRQ